MGKFIDRDEIHDARFYFEDARYTTNGRGRWTYGWPSKNFPHQCAIHIDRIGNVNRIEMRRWVEQNTNETIIHQTIDLSYRRYFHQQDSWKENYYEVTNLWFVVYFEDEMTLTAFKLAFSDKVSEMTKHHPNKPEDAHHMTNPNYKTNKSEYLDDFTDYDECDYGE